MEQWYTFEFLVVCIGKYGDIPKLPTFPPKKGQEVFHGKVLHSLDYAKLDKETARALLKGKKVAIVGYKKSAIDLAVECAEANQGMCMNIYQENCICRPLIHTFNAHHMWVLNKFLEIMKVMLMVV